MVCYDNIAAGHVYLINIKDRAPADGPESCLGRANVTQHVCLIMYATIQFRKNTTILSNDTFQEVQIYAERFKGHEATHSFL